MSPCSFSRWITISLETSDRLRWSLLTVPGWLLYMGEMICSVMPLKIRTTSVLTWVLQNFLVTTSYFTLSWNRYSTPEIPAPCNSSYLPYLSLLSWSRHRSIWRPLIRWSCFGILFFSFAFRSSSFVGVYMGWMCSWCCSLLSIWPSVSLIERSLCGCSERRMLLLGYGFLHSHYLPFCDIYQRPGCKVRSFWEDRLYHIMSCLTFLSFLSCL